MIDVAADGSRFLMMREAPRAEGARRLRLIVVENFMAEVERMLRR